MWYANKSSKWTSSSVLISWEIMTSNGPNFSCTSTLNCNKSSTEWSQKAMSENMSRKNERKFNCNCSKRNSKTKHKNKSKSNSSNSPKETSNWPCSENKSNKNNNAKDSKISSKNKLKEATYLKINSRKKSVFWNKRKNSSTNSRAMLLDRGLIIGQKLKGWRLNSKDWAWRNWCKIRYLSSGKSLSK